MAQVVYYWRGSAEERQDIVSALKGVGLEIIQHRTLEDVLDRVDRDKPKIIVVDGSAGHREAARRVIELAGTAKLYSKTLVFISAQAEKRCESLGKSFTGVIPVDVPYRLDTVIKAIQSLAFGGASPQEVREFVAKATPAQEQSVREGAPLATSQLEEAEYSRDSVAEDSEQEPELIETSPVSEQTTVVLVSKEAQTGEEESVKPAQAPDGAKGGTGRRRRRLEDNTAQIRKRMKSQADPTRLVGFGGEALAIARDPDDFVDEPLLLNNSTEAAQLLRSLAESDRWLAAQAKRVAYVCAAICSALSLGQERDISLRTAGLFINLALRDKPADLMRYDLIRKPSVDMNQVLGENFIQSGLLVEKRLSDARAAKLIKAVANILRSKKQNLDDDLLLDAETLLGVELSSRSCWSLGYWQPIGAHRAIRHFRSEDSLIKSEQIRSALIRVLGEAVTVHVTVGNIFTSLMEEEAELAAAREAKIREASAALSEAAAEKAKLPGSKTIRVKIRDLVPGMLLVEPVIARDGRLILDANIVLSEQIVQDLWQLASVRALNSQVDVAVSV